VSVLISCLTGRALEWANAVWNGPDSARDHYPEFTRRFRDVFDHPPPGESAPDSPRGVGHMFVLTSFPGFSPSLQHKALVDSGAAGNFMDHGLALRLGIPLVS
jgi:hypothetical protein